MDFNGKVVIITGASSGIGAQTTVQFASRGATVVLCGRNAENLHKTALKCQENGAAQENVFEMIGDLLEDNHLQDIIDNTIKRYGKINVLVNNAGCGLKATIEESSINDFDDMYKINARAPIHLSKLAIPHLLNTKGCIVNMSSVGSMRLIPTLPAYGCAKAALDAFTTAAALEFAPSGVRVNAVNPGTIRTEIFLKDGHVTSLDEFGDFMNLLGTVHPMGRVGTVQEVADAVLFLASDMASFITGVTLSVDGGRHATSWRPQPAAH